MGTRTDENGQRNEDTLDECSLPASAQTRNLVLFGINTSLSYLASPITFINVHATCCKQLGASATVANLPSTAYLAMAAFPLLVAWYFPAVSLFRRILVLSYAAFAASSAAVAVILLLPVAAWVKIAALVAHGALTGAALTVAVTFLFESLRRGVSEARRGQALGLGYGVGPILALLASQVVQWILPPEEKAGELATPDVIRGYALLFAASVPIMGLAAFLSSRFIIPCPEQEPVRLPFLEGVFGGIGDFLGNRVLRITTVAGILAFSGYHIFDNMLLYTRYALGEAPEQHLGNQLSLRYGFKMVTGLLMGWLLTRTNPRTVMLLTGWLGLTGVTWAFYASGSWYHLSFGPFGGGELFGVYITNYILACSPPAKVRRNLSFAVLMMVPAAAAGPLFGGIADYFGSVYSKAVGFQMSFVAAAYFIGGTLLLLLLLPSRPRPETSP
jgi:MFS family permease